MRTRLLSVLLAGAMFAFAPASAQQKWPPIAPAAEQTLAKIAKHAAVAKPLEGTRSDSVRMFEEQLRISEIGASKA